MVRGWRLSASIALVVALATPTVVAQYPSASSAASASAPAIASSVPTPVPLANSAPTIAAPPVSSDAAANARPFGPGYLVSLSCDRPLVDGFIAKGAVDSRPSFPDPFVKIGRLPIVVELPPGTYTLIVEGTTVTSGSTVFEVRQAPTEIRVHGGSSSLRELSTWMTAFGVVAVLAGGVFAVSGVKGGSSKEKNSIAIPLLIGGGVALASGVTMRFVSGTSFESNAFVPGRSSSPAAWLSPGLLISGQF